MFTGYYPQQIPNTVAIKLTFLLHMKGKLTTEYCDATHSDGNINGSGEINLSNTEP